MDTLTLKRWTKGNMDRIYVNCRWFASTDKVFIYADKDGNARLSKKIGFYNRQIINALETVKGLYGEYIKDGKFHNKTFADLAAEVEAGNNTAEFSCC